MQISKSVSPSSFYVTRHVVEHRYDAFVAISVDAAITSGGSAWFLLNQQPRTRGASAPPLRRRAAAPVTPVPRPAPSSAESSGRPVFQGGWYRVAPPEDSWDLRRATAPTTLAPAMPGPHRGWRRGRVAPRCDRAPPCHANATGGSKRGSKFRVFNTSNLFLARNQ